MADPNLSSFIWSVADLLRGETLRAYLQAFSPAVRDISSQIDVRLHSKNSPHDPDTQDHSDLPAGRRSASYPCDSFGYQGRCPRLR